MQAASATYTAHGNARSLTHWMRPGIEPEISWFLVRFVSAVPCCDLFIFLFSISFLFVLLHFFFFFGLFRASPTAYGSSQARGQIGATAFGLYQSHSNTKSLTHWSGPRIEPTSSWILVGFITTEPGRNSDTYILFFRFFFLVDYYKILSIVPCVIQ